MRWGQRLRISSRASTTDLQLQDLCKALSSWASRRRHLPQSSLVGDRIASSAIGNIPPNVSLSILLTLFSIAYEWGVHVIKPSGSDSERSKSRNVSLLTSCVLPRGFGIRSFLYVNSPYPSTRVNLFTRTPLGWLRSRDSLVSRAQRCKRPGA